MRQLKRVIIRAIENLPSSVDINSKTASGDTALSLAAENGHPKVVGILLEKGANEGLGKAFGLAEAKRDASIIKDLSVAIVLAAIKSADWQAIKDLPAGIDIDSQGYNGVTALNWAACNGNDEAVEALIAKGADVNRPGADGRTPLMNAVEKGSSQIVEILIKAGAKIDAKSSRDITAPMLAKDQEIIKILSQRRIEQVEQMLKEVAQREEILLKEIANAQDPSLLLTDLHELYHQAITSGSLDAEQVFELSIRAAQNTLPPAGTLLFDMADAVSKGEKAQDNPDFGAYFSNLDTGILKGGVICIHDRLIDGEKKYHIQFKLSEFARKDLAQNLALLEHEENKEVFQKLLPEGLAVKSMRTVPDTFLGKADKNDSFTDKAGYALPNAEACEIEFQNGAKVIIGRSEDLYKCLYDEVNVIIPHGQVKGEELQMAHAVLAVLGVGPIFNAKRAADKERMEIAQIFRTYFPGDAFAMERTKAFYELPINALKKWITGVQPEMQAKFDHYYKDHPEELTTRAIYSGKEVVCLNDISKQMRANGAIGLMIGMGSSSRDTKAADAAASVIARLITGSLSSQDRFKAGLFRKGASCESDFRAGGSGSVFTRLVNAQTKENETMYQIPMSGPFQILFNLDAVNQGAYAYNDDKFGAKSDYYYKNRSNLIDFAKNADSCANEVMVNSRITPDLIKGVVCQSEENKKMLVDQIIKASSDLEKVGKQALVKIVNGKQTVNGIPLEEFIHVAETFDAKMWA